MISFKRNFLFIHYPKTAGNSIQESLLPFSDDVITKEKPHQDGIERFGVSNEELGTLKHFTYKQYSEIIEPEVFSKIFKFSTIRNPWERLISFFFSPHRGCIVWSKQEFLKFINQVLPFCHYVSPSCSERELCPALDYVIRYENLKEDFQKVTKLIGVCVKSPKIRNKSIRQHYSRYYDDELIELIRYKFKEEIEFGNYSFERE